MRFTSSARDADGDAVSRVGLRRRRARGRPEATHTFTAAGTYTVTATATDTKGNTGSATLSVVVAAPQGLAGSAPAAAPRGGLESVSRASLATFRKRGVKVTLACGAAGRGTAVLRVSRATAQRLGLARRALAARKVTCAAGRTVAVRVQPSRRVRAALRAQRPAALRVTLRLSLPGAETIRRTLTLRR